MGKQRREGKLLQGTAQMSHCVKLLMKHEIDRVAVQSILNYAYEFDLFGDRDFLKQTDEESEEEPAPSVIELSPMENERASQSMIHTSTPQHIQAVSSQDMESMAGNQYHL